MNKIQEFFSEQFGTVRTVNLDGIIYFYGIDIAKALGIDIVPIIFEGTIQEAVDFVKKNPDSTMGTAKMEGLVGRPKIELRDRCGNRVIVKIKYEDFK